MDCGAPSLKNGKDMIMTSKGSPNTGICCNCESKYSENDETCPACSNHVGFPNVRFSDSSENVNALIERFLLARKSAKSRGCYKEFQEFRKHIKKKSGVVISMPAGIFRDLIKTPNKIYRNYEQLVQASEISSRGAQFDNLRHAISGCLFGSYNNKIAYGVLSLNKEGLPTYGDVFCLLRPVTIEKRTSFLEENSYRFVEKHNILSGRPVGNWATWRTKHLLALVKLERFIEKGQKETDWENVFFLTNGKDRNLDDFIEAHIYGSINYSSIENAMPAPNKKLGRLEKLDIEAGMSRLEKLKEKR